MCGGMLSQGSRCFISGALSSSRRRRRRCLYYKRVDPCLCSELAPVLEGVAADTHGKVRASTVFMSYSLHVSIVGFFTIRQKRIRGGGAFAEGISILKAKLRTFKHIRTYLSKFRTFEVT